jgi:hypothetical protein
MNKAVSLALLACGILFLILGIHESDTFSSDVSRFFTGSATDKATWMLVGGIVGIALGSVAPVEEKLRIAFLRF